MGNSFKTIINSSECYELTLFILQKYCSALNYCKAFLDSQYGYDFACAVDLKEYSENSPVAFTEVAETWDSFSSKECKYLEAYKFTQLPDHHSMLKTLIHYAYMRSYNIPLTKEEVASGQYT